MRGVFRVRAGMRTVSVLAAVAVAVLGSGMAVASGALASSKPAVTFVAPSPSEDATLTTSSVQIEFTYNRTPKQTRSLVCSLSGPTSS